MPHLLFSLIEDILNIPDLMQVRHKNEYVSSIHLIIVLNIYFNNIL